MKNMQISRQILFVTALAVAIMVVVQSGVVAYLARQIAIKQTESSLNEQTSLIVTTLEFAQETLKQRAMGNLSEFERSLQGKVKFGNRNVETGKEMLPELLVNGVTVNGNLALIETYAKTFPGREPSFIVRRGDQFFRAATLLKDSNGVSRVGEALSEKEAYIPALLKGESYTGTIQRSGKMFSIAVNPIKDDGGNVIGAITLRLDVGSNIALLKKKLLETKVGKTGYPYVISEPYGDEKEGSFVVHPKLEGKKVSEAGPLVASITEKIYKVRNGTIEYKWLDAEGKERDKIVVVRELPELHWIIASGSWTDEFTDDTLSLRNKVIIVSLMLGLLLLAALNWLTKSRLQPVTDLVAVSNRLGAGDFSVDLKGNPQSRNEVDVLSNSLGQAIASIRALIGNLKRTGSNLHDTASVLSDASGSLQSATARQSEAASTMSASAEQLTVGIEQVADSARSALGMTQEANKVLEQSQATVGKAIEAMQHTASTVQRSAEQVTDLGRRSQEIEQALSSIKGIAEQTNLLALNAAIEAARAGEAGRGFAVVADEVRKLAEQSGKSAQDISAILSQVQMGVGSVTDTISEAVTQVTHSVEASRNLEAALGEVSSQSVKLGESIRNIASVTREQSAAAESIAHEIEHVANMAQETGAAAHANQGRANDLVNAADSLQAETARFRV